MSPVRVFARLQDPNISRLDHGIFYLLATPLFIVEVIDLVKIFRLIFRVLFLGLRDRCFLVLGGQGKDELPSSFSFLSCIFYQLCCFFRFYLALLEIMQKVAESQVVHACLAVESYWQGHERILLHRFIVHFHIVKERLLVAKVVIVFNAIVDGLEVKCAEKFVCVLVFFRAVNIFWCD